MRLPPYLHCNFSVLFLFSLFLVSKRALAQVAPYGKQDCLYENCLPSQSGYLDGYNFDPAIVGSPSFGQLWNTITGNDYFLSQPLTYTPPGGKQVVIAMSESNKIYVLDAISGVILTTRNVGASFLAQDSQCADISPIIGITSTPVIDPATGTLYFWSKTYKDLTGATTGLDNGRYLFYGVDAITLQDKFTPYNPQGIIPANNPNQSFEGGKQLQRVGLQLIDGVIYSGFGGHCDNFNYTGYILGNDAVTGQLVNSFSTQAGPSAGKGSGVWQAGGALAYDGKYIFFVTGNGFGEELTNPRLGSSPPGALAMAVTKLAIDSTTKNLTAIDFFVPSDYRSIDAADQDFGSSGVCLLPTGFAQGSVRRLAIANGKNSKAYIMNADNLGGYKTGANGGDGNIQTIALGGQTFSTAGGYPFEGGYIYISAVNSPTIALKLGSDANGGPLFSQVGQTADIAPNIRGTGHTTVTSNKGQPGSGLVWITDTQNGNIRVYPAIPPTTGMWNHLFSAQLPRGGVKYGRVVPGSGRMFVASTSGTITAFGSPVNQPFNCTSGLDFGTTTIGQNSTVQITCLPNISSKINSITISNNTVTISNVPNLPTAQLNPNKDSFSFNATWSPNWSGSYLFSITLNTTNAQAGYVTSQPISIIGKAVSSQPLLSLSPTNIAFGGLTPGNSLTVGGINKTVIIANNGLQSLRILTWDFDEFYDLGDDDNDNDSTNTNVPLDQKNTTGNFTLYGMPLTVQPLSSISVVINYNPTVFGDYTGNLTIITDGGKGTTIMTGTAASSGEMHFMTQQYTGNYLIDVPFMDFGIVTSSITTFSPKQSQILLVNNTGGSALQLTKSKPPTSPIIQAQNPTSDLTEGQYIAPFGFSTANIYTQAPIQQANVPAYNVTDQWVLNANGDNAGVRFIQLSARIVSPQIGPLLNKTTYGDLNGTARYTYLGCYSETAPGNRTFATSANLPTVNFTTEACLFAAAASGGPGNFVATEYGRECWFRATPPVTTKVSDEKCNMPCTGNANQYCGASGFMSVFYDALAYNASSGTLLPGAYQGAFEVQSTGNWTTLGCVTEGANGARALTGPTFTSSNMTVELCTSTCQSKQQKYAGVEYANECYCGNSISNNATSNAGGCIMSCKGSNRQLCGGSRVLNLYIYNQTGSTTLSTTFVSSSTFTSSSISTLKLTSTSTSSSTPAPTSTSTSSSVTATKMTSISTSTTITTSSSSTISTSSSTSLPSGIISLGCYQDSVNRTLTLNTYSNSSNTPTFCATQCRQLGYRYSGVEYGNYCYCDNYILNTGLRSGSGQTGCTFTCSGDKTQKCGGSNRIQIYQDSNWNQKVFTLQLYNKWNLTDCMIDKVGSRTLNVTFPSSNSQTVETCLQQCQNKNLPYCGMEYGKECYGGFLTAVNLTSLSAPSSGNDDPLARGCNMACTGNTTKSCGGSNRLIVYAFNPNTTAVNNPATF